MTADKLDSNLIPYYEGIERTGREELGGAYVGVWAQPTPRYITVLLSQLTFFSGFLLCKLPI